MNGVKRNKMRRKGTEWKGNEIEGNGRKGKITIILSFYILRDKKVKRVKYSYCIKSVNDQLI